MAFPALAGLGTSVLSGGFIPGRKEGTPVTWDSRTGCAHARFGGGDTLSSAIEEEEAASLRSGEGQASGIEFLCVMPPDGGVFVHVSYSLRAIGLDTVTFTFTRNAVAGWSRVSGSHLGSRGGLETRLQGFEAARP